MVTQMLGTVNPKDAIQITIRQGTRLDSEAKTMDTPKMVPMNAWKKQHQLGMLLKFLYGNCIEHSVFCKNNTKRDVAINICEKLL
jgi:hypothetical protein